MYFGNPALLWAIVGVFAALSVGTLARYTALRGASTKVAQSRFSSLKTWWTLAILLTLAIVAGHTGVILVLAAAGVLALREYLRLVGWKAVGLPTIVIVFAFVPLHYLPILFGHGEVVRAVAPMAFLVALGAVRAWLGLIDGYLRTTAALFWGLMLFLYCLSHAAFLLSLPATSQPLVGNIGWFLYLVILTESNDISQAIIGRRFGTRKITPRVSPNKSVEGLVGGITVTMVLAVSLAPWLTTLFHERPWNAGVIYSLLSGILISIFGFLGDINMSAIKRDVGVKDGSALLPGQGGMIDRIDSLTFTAPVYYYFVRVVMEAS